MLGLVIAANLHLAAGSVASAQDPHLGIAEYEISCMPCHGIDGRGGGPSAKFLMKAPTDLTKIAKLNDGVFPAERLAEIIDGRAIVASHGQRDMPIWGDRYRVRVDPYEPRSEIERRGRAHIAALVEYLRSIQEK
jgi:mono/diheme cytochrome c family protein